MKKSLLALGAACMALGAMGAAPQKASRNSVVSFEKNMDLKGPGILRSPSAPSLKKAPAKINSAQDVITSVEGTVQDVSVSGSGYMVFWGSLYYYENESVASHVVYGDNNEVYIYNILPNGLTNSYVKGVKDGDKVVVDLPQTLVWSDEAEDGFNLALYDYVEYEENGELTAWYFISDESSMTFSVAEDGTLTADGVSEGKILALGNCSDADWAGYGVWDLAITPFNDKVVEVPADIEVSENFWVIRQDGYGQFVNFAQGGEEMYLQGLFTASPEAWVKASVEYEDYTATVSIAQDQYLGLGYDSYFMYTKCAKLVEDKDGNFEYEFMPDGYCYELTWDFEEETMVAKDPEVVLLFNVGKDRPDALGEVYDLKLEHQDSFEGTPLDPYGLSYDDSKMVDYDYAAFKFYVPAVSTEGDCLLPGDLSYVVFVDGEEWTFDADEYDIAEDLEEIPWTFNDYWICYGFDAEIEREVDFFVEGITTLGVQSIYRYNGEETRSEIVTIDLDDPTAVTAVGAGKKVADVKYYGIDGREVANPAAGIFIKRVTFEDGSVATFKKAVR